MKQKNLVLMVVAVGCGLVAAFLTSQMSGKSAAVERVEVIVAAKDLMIGSQLSKEDLKTALKRKTVAKDAVPPTVIETEEELLEKRFTRTIRAEEMIDKKDVTKGGLVSIPPGMSMVSLPISLPHAVAGFVGPGSRVDVLGSIQLEQKTLALPVLVNMLILAVDANITGPQGQAAYQNLSTVSFAVDRKQALLIKLAQARSCDLSLLLRNPEDKDTENDKNYDIDKVIKLLADRHRGVGVVDEDESDPDRPKKPDPRKPGSPDPKQETVKVPAAAEDIPAGTQLTTDLVAEKFKLIELPKDVAADAITDLAPLVESQEVLKNGLGKGQWVTKSLVGRALKPAPGRDVFEPKPGPNETAKPTGRRTHDVTVHTATGTKVFRYEEVAPGEWKLAGHAPKQAAAQEPKPQEGATPEKTVD